MIKPPMQRYTHSVWEHVLQKVKSMKGYWVQLWNGD